MAFAGSLVAIGMTVFEAGKSLVFPAISIWGSSAITIAFATLASVVTFRAISGKLYAWQSELEAELGRRRTAERRLEESLSKSLGEKEILFRELNHRVRNNFQILSSMLSLEATSIEDAEARGIQLETRDRVLSVAAARASGSRCAPRASGSSSARRSI